MCLAVNSAIGIRLDLRISLQSSKPLPSGRFISKISRSNDFCCSSAFASAIVRQRTNPKCKFQIHCCYKPRMDATVFLYSSFISPFSICFIVYHNLSIFQTTRIFSLPITELRNAHFCQVFMYRLASLLVWLLRHIDLESRIFSISYVS